MANPNDMKNQLAKKEETAGLSIFDQIERQKPAIQRAFGSDEEKYAVQFIRQARTLMQLNPKLQACTPDSLLGAMMLAAQLKLQLNPGLNTAFLVPYAKMVKRGSEWVVDHYEAQFQIGYGGYLELFYRHEKAVSLDVYTVYEGDDFSFSLGTDARIHHVPNLISQGEPYAWYAVATLEGGHKKFLVMSRNQIMVNAKKSQAWDSYKGCFKPKSSWETDFDAMARKTVIKQLSKTLPLSTDLSTAISQDGAVKNFRDGVNIIDAPTEEYVETPALTDTRVPDPAKEITQEPTQEPKPKPKPESKAPEPKKDSSGLIDEMDSMIALVDDKASDDPIWAEIMQSINDGNDDDAKALLVKARAMFFASSAQQKMIYAKAKKLKIELSDLIPGVSSTTDLTKKAASEVIEKLIAMENGKEPPAQDEIPLPDEPGKDW